MCGYGIITVLDAKIGLVCPECSHLVKEAVQTPDGVRLCKSCYESIARYELFVNCAISGSYRIGSSLFFFNVR